MLSLLLMLSAVNNVVVVVVVVSCCVVAYTLGQLAVRGLRSEHAHLRKKALPMVTFFTSLVKSLFTTAMNVE